MNMTRSGSAPSSFRTASRIASAVHANVRSASARFGNGFEPVRPMKIAGSAASVTG
jgi:hypothetical protein